MWKVHITSTIAYFKMNDQGGERTWSNCQMWRCGGSTFLHKTSTFLHNVPHNIQKHLHSSTMFHITSTLLHKTSTFLHNVPHNIHIAPQIIHIPPQSSTLHPHSSTMFHIPSTKHPHSSTIFHITSTKHPHSSTMFHITSTKQPHSSTKHPHCYCGNVDFFLIILTNYPFINFIKKSNT